MNAAETIAAAIEKLEMERDEAALGPWSKYDDEGLLALHASDGYSIAIDFDRENADLIVTLHRTIDAQLAILRGFEDHLTNPVWDHDDDEESAPAVLDVVALARAILGEAS